jgi:4'-phosphopantetheinyl transferase
MTTRLWWVRPEDFQASRAALALLNAEERQQQQRYIPPAKRHEYLVTRVLVRSVLGEALGMEPAALQFVNNEWGRPALAHGSTSTPIYFNISHTDGLVVCLISTEYELGVDTELLSRAQSLLAMAADVFAPKELGDLGALSEDEQMLRAVHLWTLKESYIKARSMGLALPLDGFAFRFSGGRISLEVEAELNDDGARWQFQTQMLGPHCVSMAFALPAGQRQAGFRERVIAVENQIF